MLTANRRWAGALVMVALVYYGTARLGLLLQLPGTNASPVWPPSGFGFAAVLLAGLRLWPGIAIGAFLANLLTLPHTPAGLLAAGAIGVGNTLEQVVALLLLRRFVTVPSPFERARDVFAFIVTAIVACAVASTNGSVWLWLTGIIPGTLIGSVWFTWWLGDTAGMLVLTPALYFWWHAPRLALSGARTLELVALVGLTALTAELLFGGWVASAVIDSLPYLVVPSLMWAAFRFGQREAATLTVLYSGIAIFHTWSLMGRMADALVAAPRVYAPFVSPAISANDSLLMLQLFICAVAGTALVLAAAVAERSRADNQLRQLNAELEHRVHERTAELASTNRRLRDEVAERQRAEEAMRQLSLADEQTGLHNRRGFFLLADQSLKDAHRAGMNCSLMYIDLDGLKEVNDSFGHEVGDAMIADAGRLLRTTFREPDVLARLGGDEFAVLMTHTGNSVSVAPSRLQAELDVWNQASRRPYRLCMSIGVVDATPTTRRSLDSLLAEADQAMYANKRVRRESPGEPSSQETPHPAGASVSNSRGS